MKCPSCGKSLWFVRTFCPFCKTTISAPARPRPVTIISWFAIVFGGVVFLVSLFLAKSPDGQRVISDYRSQHPFLYARILAGPLVALACGTFMLRGANWARWLFALLFGYNVISNIAYSSSRSLGPDLLGGLIFGAAVYHLFRPAATAFFRGRAVEKPGVPATNGSDSSVATSTQAACAECSGMFSTEDLISYDGVQVCAGCKPIFIQRLLEGAKIRRGSDPAKNDES